MIGHSVYLDNAGCLTLKSGKEIHIHESVFKLCDLTKGDLATVGPGDHSYIPVIRCVVTAAFGPHQDFTTGGLHATRRQIQTRTSDCLGDFPQGETIPPEGLLRDLYVNLPLTDT